MDKNGIFRCGVVQMLSIKVPLESHANNETASFILQTVYDFFAGGANYAIIIMHIHHWL